jgi:hypothetical protein
MLRWFKALIQDERRPSQTGPWNQQPSITELRRLHRLLQDYAITRGSHSEHP